MIDIQQRNHEPDEVYIGQETCLFAVPNASTSQ